MKITKSNSTTKQILVGMIKDRNVLATLVNVYHSNLFLEKWQNLVAKWCVDYYHKYQMPPGEDIEAIFDNWIQDKRDSATSRALEAFFNSIYQDLRSSVEPNSQYLVDAAGVHLNKCKIVHLSHEIQDALAAGRIEQAQKAIANYSRIEIGQGAGIDVLRNKEAIRQAFDNARNPVITFRGGLGEFFQDHLARDSFIGFVGADKRGKSWWLLHLAWQAMLQKRKVAFFEVGDQSQDQIMVRFMARAARTPLRPQVVDFPMGFEDGRLQRKTKEFRDPLTWKKAFNACRNVIRKTATNETLLKLSCHPNSSISVHGIESILEQWDREGWSPDVICIDYADILAPPSGVDEDREQINLTWKHLRRMSQARHCLVLTASQSDAAGYKAKTLTRSNFSDDKRKNAHVTGMVGINRTEIDEEEGVQRLNWIVLREGQFSESQCVRVAPCLAIGNPAVCSTMKKPDD